MIPVARLRVSLRALHSRVSRRARSSPLTLITRSESNVVHAETATLFSLKDYIVQTSPDTCSLARRYQSCRSVEEVLVFALDGDEMNSNELIACLDALVRIQYNVIRASQWAYYDKDLVLWVQSNINAEAQAYFFNLHHHRLFKDLLREAERVVDTLSAEDTVTMLHSLLKLCVAKEHDVLVRLQEKSVGRLHELGLKSVSLLSEIANFMKRNGFIVNSLACSAIQEMLDSTTLPESAFHDLALAVSNIGYFSSPEFLVRILNKGATLLPAEGNLTSLEDSLLFLEAGTRFASLDRPTARPFLQHLLRYRKELTIHQLCRLARSMTFDNVITDEEKELLRSQALVRLERGLLRASDVVSLVGVFDAVGWSDDVVRELTDLLLIHVPDFDTLCVKHFANSNFVTLCTDQKLMRQFAHRWVLKLPDIFGSLSVLMTLLDFCNRVTSVPRYAQLVLQDRLMQALAGGQLAEHPEKVASCCCFLLKYGTSEAVEVALAHVDRMCGQLLPQHFYALMHAVVYKRSIAQKHDLPRAWYEHVLQKSNEMPNLQIASYLFNKFFPPRSLLPRREASAWADIFERNAPSVGTSAFRNTLLAVSNHRLYVPATLQALADFALEKRLSVGTTSGLLDACASVNFRPNNISRLYEAYVVKLLKDDEKECFVKYALRFASALLSLDFLPKLLVETIFSLDFLRRFDEEFEGRFGRRRRPMTWTGCSSRSTDRRYFNIQSWTCPG
ncbi:uncharacterized protein LOC135387846 isoform X2 [Ornithodoros turicata]|uniref:uncharacterized protein LOC135387846 isoform X2 n=1 Tax=Ornithodoros turicata TaxID=34597 RepID=UPI0031397D95